MAFFHNGVAIALSVALLSMASATPTTFIPNLSRQTPECSINSVCFALDQSGSISISEYEEEQAFVVAIAEELATRTANIRYSAYGFSTGSSLIQGSTLDLTGTFIPAVTAFVNPSGGTNMYAGLNACFNGLSGRSGNRVIVLITDGQDTQTPMADEIAPTIKAAGVSIVTVGIGNNVDADYLMGLASGPRFFIESMFDNLPAEVIQVAESSCMAAVMTPPPPPPTTPPTMPPTTSPTLPPSTGSACARAYDACDFRFEGARSVPTFAIGGRPDRSFTKKIVSRKPGQILGVLNTNGIFPEFIMSDGSARLITTFGMPRFTPTHFKPFFVRATTSMKRGSGIGYQTFHGDQLAVARGKCVRVHFTEFQVLMSNGNVESNQRVNKSANKCVVFWTR